MTNPSDTPPTTPVGRKKDPDPVVVLFGGDPWMRYDLWSTRAWEAAQGAVEMSAAIGAPTGSDESLDPRIITLFHAAEVAKRFAEMVNPISAVSGSSGHGSFDAVTPAEVLIAMISDDEA